jgi:hypothetical protein
MSSGKRQPFEGPCVSIPQSTVSFQSTTSRLPYPAAVNRRHIVWSYAITVGLYHLVALLALLPWFFSWTGVGLAQVLAWHALRTLGIADWPPGFGRLFETPWPVKDAA